MILAFKLSDIITVPFGWLLALLYHTTNNYGIALIIFGSMRISFKSDGPFLYSNLTISPFMQMDLPLPVPPAISRCGMDSRSHTTS